MFIKTKILAGLCVLVGGAAFGAVDVAPHFGFGANVRDVVGRYYETGLGCWLEASRFHNHFYLGYQKEFGIAEESEVAHASAYRVGDTAAYLLRQDLPGIYVGLNVEYYEWRKSGLPAAGTDFWMPAFGVKIDWEGFTLLAENLGPYGYGFEPGEGRWNNVTSARAFFRLSRHVGVYVASACDWTRHTYRVGELRGGEISWTERTEFDTGWFFGVGPIFSF